MELQNDLLIKTARGEDTYRTPVWVMRQAGRILKEYRDVRASVSGFIELVKTPHLAAEVTIQPVDLLGTDAAIIFSDILVIPEAMGLPYEMIEAKGPVFHKTVNTADDLRQLRMAGEEDLNYVYEAIKITKKELNGRVPLIGFAGAPWTIFCYMTEGKGSKDFSQARKLMYSNPELAKKLLEMITDSTIVYLNGQIAAGANLVQLFDSWAGVLSGEQYEKWALPYIKKICSEVNMAPITVFAKGADGARAALGRTQCDIIGIDWTMNITESRILIGADKTLQGSLDPAVLYGSFDDIKKHTRAMLDEFGPRRHIANLGHGVYPDTDPDKVRCFIDTVKEYSPSLRA